MRNELFLTLVTDLDRSRVLYVAEDRKQSSLDGFWKTLSAEQLASIEGVAMDMWDPYEKSIRQHLPQAEEKIVYDKFHVAKQRGEAVERGSPRLIAPFPVRRHVSQRNVVHDDEQDVVETARSSGGEREAQDGDQRADGGQCTARADAPTRSG